MNYGLLLEYHLLYFVNRRHIPIVFEIAFGSELSSIARQNRHFATIQAANLQVRYRSDHICKCTQNSQNTSHNLHATSIPFENDEVIVSSQQELRRLRTQSYHLFDKK